nr:reverse transcriptase domain-containing protein [Tanacetum cinerariifolium]
MTANKIDVTDEAYEEYSQEVLDFSDVTVCEAKTIKSFVDEPPEVELKDLPPHLEYAFLEGDNKLPVIIAKELGDEEKSALIKILNPWVSPVHYVPKKGGFTVVKNEENELIPTRLVTEWRVCIDYRKLNDATRKDHFPLPFMDQMLKQLARNEYYCFLDGFSSYFQIPIDPRDQEKTTFTCPYGTFAYRRMPFGLCNASGMFQRCMLAIFHDMVEKMMEVFMDDFLVFGNSFKNCLSRLDKMMQRCEDTKLCLNWEKSHFMVKEGIVLGHKISKNGIEVDKAKLDVLTKLPHPTTVKDPRVPLILGRCFLKTSRALIDVHKGKLTLRIKNEAITYNLDQTSRYSVNYDQMTANKIDVTDEACEEYSQEVLDFSDVTASGNPTPSDDPIVSTTSPTLTPFRDSDFLLFEEADAFLGLEDDLDSPKLDPSYYDSEGDILLLEAILNSKPSPPIPDHV